MNRRTLFQTIGLLGVFSLAACANNGQQVAAVPPTVQPAPGPVVTGPAQSGQASWMHRNLNGRRTASGERHDIDDITAAHRTLPFNSYARVTSVETGQSIIVRINDRGPFVRGRIIDLSEAAASQIGIRNAGVGAVTVEPVSSPG